MTERLAVRILDRDYRLSCEPDERERLLAAVARVDAEMHGIRAGGKIAGAERIAVLAALQIASGAGPAAAASSAVPTTPDAPASEVDDEAILRRMRSIHALLDTALADQERLF